MRSITEVPCHCTACVWMGVTGDCTDNADDGELVCPACGAELVIEYSPEERGFWPDKESPDDWG